MAGLAEILSAAAGHRLAALGLLGALPGDPVPDGTKSILLLGPDGAGFWNHFRTQPEFSDNRPDPVDRWSERVITRLAEDSGSAPVFPFGRTPPAPFISWALRSGEAWVSPVGLLVHARAGLWVSYRGALALPFEARAAIAENPCDSCATRPCLSACPVGALGSEGYDLPRCHAYLESPRGTDCMGRGCAVRRACPVSDQYGRDPAQSAHHMKAFHP